MIRNRNIKRLTLILIICLPFNVNAADVSYSAGLLLAQYTNVSRVPNPIEKETSYTLIAALTATEDTADYSVFVDGNIRSIDYTKDIVADRVTGDILANLVWKISPGRFDWYLNDTFTQTAIVSIANNSPDNRQNVNIISTGPDYTIRISATNNLLFSGRIENYKYENRRSLGLGLVSRDNNRGTLAIRWSKQMNSRLSMSLNDEAEVIRYDNNQINSYDRNDVYLAVNYSSGLHILDAQYGYTNVRNEISDNVQYDRYLLTVNRASTRNSSMRLSFQKIATDTGRQIAQNIATNMTNNTISNLASNDIFVDKTLRAQYLKAAITGGLSLDFYNRERTYRQQSFLDEVSKGAVLNGNWTFQHGDNINYVASYINTLYKNPALNREDDDIRYSITYNHRLRRNFIVGLSAISSERESTDSRFSYEDVTIILNLNYSSL